uniref:Uncharacterized protein n=1 Tax=Oryza barthii TaxID=65489 RepID=A0A0D3G1P9_9ORYZ
MSRFISINMNVKNGKMTYIMKRRDSPPPGASLASCVCVVVVEGNDPAAVGSQEIAVPYRYTRYSSTCSRRKGMEMSRRTKLNRLRPCALGFIRAVDGRLVLYIAPSRWPMLGGSRGGNPVDLVAYTPLHRVAAPLQHRASRFLRLWSRLSLPPRLHPIRAARCFPPPRCLCPHRRRSLLPCIAPQLRQPDYGRKGAGKTERRGGR